MKKIKILIIMLILLVAVLNVTAVADDSDPPGKLKPPPEEYLVPVEYGITELSPKEAEMLKDIKGTFVIKMQGYMYFYDVANQWPVEAIVNKADKELSNLVYAFLSEDGNKYEYYEIYKNEVRKCKFYSSTPDAIINTVFRNDLFESVPLTENIEDVQVQEIYCFFSGHGKWTDMVYFKTNRGDFIWTRDKGVSEAEYLFPKDLYYEYDGYLWTIQRRLDDLSLYEVRVPSATLPPPYTADPSALFAAMAILSAAGFTLFAVNKKIKTV